MNNESRTAFISAASRYHGWFTTEALPFWADRGRDERHGGSIERVEADGSIDPELALRLRVQARQLFVYASACEHDWFDGGTYVEALWRFLEQSGRSPGRPGYSHTLVWPNGARDDRLDLYDHAFHLLAGALYGRVTGSDLARERAEEIMVLLDERLTAPAGGWYEGDYEAPFRRQNPHMHLFEAFMAWHETQPDGPWLARADTVFELFQQHFFDTDNGVVREFFTDNWSRPEDPSDDTAEPGHLLEWVWLLDWYSRLSGTSTESAQATLFATATSCGLDGGLMIDTLNHDATPRARSKRLWPMTEYIKAACVRAAAGDEAAFEHAAIAVTALFEGFIDPAGDAPYVDRLDASNLVCDARSPASSLYHLAGAQIELDRAVANLTT